MGNKFTSELISVYYIMLMNKTLLFLAAIFAIFSCSSGNNECDDASGQCNMPPLNESFCVINEMSLCIPASENECRLAASIEIEYAGASFSESCPSGYKNSPNACYNSDWGEFYCYLIMPGLSDHISSEDEKKNYYKGSVMNYGTCERTHGMWNGSGTTYGSCTIGEFCDNTSQYKCLRAKGSFVQGEYCPGSDIFGACTYNGQCYDRDDEDISQYYCLHIGGSFNEGECPGKNILGSCTTDEECSNNKSQHYCSRIGGSFVQGECPGSDIFGYCVVDGQCGAASQNVCDSYKGNFSINACPGFGYGSCTFSNSTCWENSPPADCTGDEYVFALNNGCSNSLFPYCYNSSSKSCYRIGGSVVSNNIECLMYHSYLANLDYCQDKEANME